MESQMTISCLYPDLASKCYVLGAILNAEKPRPTSTKYASAPATKRYVFNFTICDVHEESINVSCWGSIDYVLPLSSLCSIGAHVKISNPRVRLAEYHDFFPEVTSQYRMHLDQKYFSSISIYDTSCNFSLRGALDKAFHTPPKTVKCKKIRAIDLLNDNLIFSEGDFVTIVAAVLEIGSISDFKTKGRTISRQEIKLLDTSVQQCISLIIWEPFLQMFSLEWKPFNTVLQVTSARITMDRYTNSHILSTTSSTLLTMNPCTEEGQHLASFISQTNPNILKQLLHQHSQPEKFARNAAVKVPNVAALYALSLRTVENGREQAVLSCMITNLRLERAVNVKCGRCGRWAGRSSKVTDSHTCSNEACRLKNFNAVLYFDFKVTIADSTGQMAKLTLAGDTALETLQISPEKFLTLTTKERHEIENQFWLEHVEVGVLIEHRYNGKITCNIIHLQPLSFSF